MPSAVLRRSAASTASFSAGVPIDDPQRIAEAGHGAHVAHHHARVQQARRTPPALRRTAPAGSCPARDTLHARREASRSTARKLFALAAIACAQRCAACASAAGGQRGQRQRRRRRGHRIRRRTGCAARRSVPGRRNHRADARAGQRMRLRQRAQHHQIPEIRREQRGRAGDRAVLGIGLVDDQHGATVAVAAPGGGSRAGSAPGRSGLAGEHRNTSAHAAQRSTASTMPGSRAARPAAASSNGTSTSGASWSRAQTAYMPKHGGAISTASRPARQNARTSRSMPSSLPRVTSSCPARTPYSAARRSRSASGCGSG